MTQKVVDSSIEITPEMFKELYEEFRYQYTDEFYNTLNQPDK